MAYVDAFLDRKFDLVRVAERINSKRIYRDIKPVYEFYVLDQKGHHTSVTGKRCKKCTFNTNREMQDALKMYAGTETFESDVRPLFKTLRKEYETDIVPDLHVTFFDIETDFNEIHGWAPIDDPFNPVTAVSMFHRHSGKMIELVLQPDNLTYFEAQAIVDSLNSDEDQIYVKLFQEEDKLLEEFLEHIEDSDILSGWNSECYDIPYLVNRIERVLGKPHCARMCLWNQQPQPKIVDNYGKDIVSYTLSGRVHLDYMDLYKKHATQVEQSYALNAIGEKIAGASKVQYDGNLDRLYKENFQKFIEYSIQDTRLLFLIDKKLNHITSHNALAHQESIPILTTLGTVSLVETAIINEIHRQQQVVFNKKEVLEGGTGAAGAWVQDPVVGLHEEIGCSDFNSLYPSTLRSLNMSPETILGQVRQTYTDAFIQDRINKQTEKEPNYAEAWHPLFGSIEYQYIFDKDSEHELIIDLEDGTTLTGTGIEFYNMIFGPESNIVISANGTLFDRSTQGIIPKVLTKWYSERKLFKRASGDCKQLSGTAALENEQGYTTEEMNKTYDGVNRFKWFAEHEPSMKLEQRENGKWYSINSDLAMDRYKYYDLTQYIRKILLNSLYGALLNNKCRFYDKRLGQSTTLTGRNMAKHLASTINKVVTGVYDHKGGAVVYGDTDSVYFSAKKPFIDAGVEFDWNDRDAIIELYKTIGSEVGKTFPQFMCDAFNTGMERGKIIDADLEMIGSRGLFLKKKRYGILKYWEDGFRLDVNGKPGKLKAMGVEIKRSDTPKYIQVFLEDMFISLLVGSSEVELKAKVLKFKSTFIDKEPWTKGMPKTIKNLTNKTEEYNRTGKCSVGHVMAAINWNRLVKLENDNTVPSISDGSKAIVCQLKTNVYNIKTIAYPIELMDKLPQWYKNLPFDVDSMEKAVLEQKLDNLFGVLKLDLGINENANTTFSNDELFGW